MRTNDSLSLEENRLRYETILWRRLDQPGHESARVFFEDSRWHLSGSAIFAHERRPCRLDYSILCNSQWQTLSGRVGGWLGAEIIAVDFEVDAGRQWRLNGGVCPHVTDCIDIDLNFSPSTNLLPIRRLRLAVGQEAAVEAAWLRFPSFKLERLEQRYRRIDELNYHYESAGGSFTAEIQVNQAGLVTRYANFWQVEAVH